MDSEYFNRIEAYFQGKLSSEAERLFWEEMERNNKFKAEYDNYVLSIKIFDDIGKPTPEIIDKIANTKEQEKLISELQDLAQPVSDKQSPSKTRILKILSIAAAILLLVTSSYFARQLYLSFILDKNKIYVQHFQAPSYESIITHSAIKGVESSPADVKKNKPYAVWRKALTAYREGDFVQSLSLLDQVEIVLIDTINQPKLLYQLGLLNMINKKYNEAIDFLDDPKASNPTRREWLKALILLKIDVNKEQLINSFSAIADNSDNPYQDEAKKVLNKIKKLKED